MAVRPRPAEWLLAGYAIVVVVAGLVRLERYPAAVWAVVAHVLLLVLLGLFQRLPSGGTHWLRDFGPIVILLALYGALDLLSGFGAEPTYDRIVLGWERGLFGSEISREWWRAWPSPTASTVFHSAYFSYYLIVPVPVVLYLWQRRPADLARTLFSLMAVFVFCYVCFIVAPVAGPYYEYPRPDPWFLDNWAARMVYGVLERGSSFGAAFPSSHVAATWVATAATWRANRTLGTVLAAAAVLLTIGVVYCQMHYGIDALAGLATAGAVLLAVRLLFPAERPGIAPPVPS